MLLLIYYPWISRGDVSQCDRDGTILPGRAGLG